MSVDIEVDSIGRYFGDIKAVDGVSFQARKGEVLGFLGPNGAGKSTTMKLLTCFLAPSFGTARVGGFDIQKQSREVRAVLGYLPENAPLYGEMEVRQFLQFIAEVRIAETAKRSPAIDRVMDMTQLAAVAEQKIETLSKGFKRRVGLAQALIHDPAILILDEPTDGLDPNQKHEVRNLIRQMRSEKCIVLSTHILEEVDEVCSRAVIIAKGKVVADKSPDELRKLSKRSGAVVVESAQALPDAVRDEFSRLSNVRKVALETGEGKHSLTVFPVDGKSILPQVMQQLVQSGISYSDVRVERGELDEVFRSITQ